MRKLLSLVLISLISISFISALCEEGQIDINTASKEELIEIIYLGEVRAEELITLRMFDSVDELIKINGIGEAYLSKIKEQGLACVNGEVEDIEEEEILEELIEEGVVEEIKEEEEDGEIEIIILTTKTIKSQDNKENKSNYAVWGFVAFCVLLGILFILKKKKYKNEFR